MENPLPPSEGKSEKPLHHPHDMLFKAVFKRPANAGELLLAKAPPELLEILELGSIRLDDSSYMDGKMAEQRTDVTLLYNTIWGRPILIAFILEHKSYVPTFPPFQIIQYQTRVWERQTETGASGPIPVIPIIFYHGKDSWDVKPWKDYLKGWSDIFQPYTPPGGYLFIDLSEMEDAEIKRFRSGFMVTALLLMKHRLEREYLLENLTDIVNFVESDDKDDEGIRSRNLEFVLRYLQGLHTIKWEEAKQKLYSLKLTSHVMNVLEDIRTESFQEGIEERQYFSVFNLLRQGFDVNIIANVELVSVKYTTDVQKLLKKIPQVTTMLKANGLSLEAIAEKCKVPILFVKSVKRLLDKS